MDPAYTPHDDIETEPRDISVRALKATDLDRLVRIDQAHVGRARLGWLNTKLNAALKETGVRISLGAEIDGTLVGAILGSVQSGEFGQLQPVAILDTILVDPAFERRRVGDTMLAHLLRNLSALRIESIRTEVGWNEQALIRFLAKEGFAPAPRLVLERAVSG